MKRYRKANGVTKRNQSGYPNILLHFGSRDTMKGRYTMKAKTLVNAVLMAAIASFLGVADAEAVRGTVCNTAIQRLDANFDFIGETATQVQPIAQDPTVGVDGGTAVYNKTVFVPSGVNTMYVTLSTTGDTHNGAASWFTCLVDNGTADGKFCNPGAAGASANPPGWITLQKLPQSEYMVNNCFDGTGGSADCHDNGIYYQWCTSIAPGTHEVELRMGTSIGGSPVFIEESHFYIDVSCISGNNRCTEKLPDFKIP